MSTPARRILFVLLWRAAPYEGLKTWGSSALTEGLGSAPPLSHGLSNSASFVVRMLEAAGVEAKLVHVASDNDIWKEIQVYQPTDVILEAFWCRPKKLDDLQPLFPDVRFIIRGHSSTPFLAHDTYGFKWAMDYLDKGAIVAPNDRRHLAELRFLAAQKGAGPSQVAYLPNYYPDDLTIAPRTMPDPRFINVGCFGAARPFKNMVGQALAAMMFADRIGRRLRFHVNGDRVECGGGPTIKNPEWIFAANPYAELVRHEWMPHAAFRALVGEMDMTMQVSFAETFCIVAADAVSQGVPTVMSTEIPWAWGGAVADPTDTVAIAAIMQRAWDRRHEMRWHDPVRDGLNAFCHETRQIWLDYFRD